MTESSATASAEAAVEVAVDPPTAFKIFTEEIDLWWVRGPINFMDSARLLELRLEPGVGGRFMEVYGTDPEDVLVSGRITVWEPGRSFAYRNPAEDVETRVSFAPLDGGTRVTVVQTLLSADADQTFVWPNILHWLPAWIDRRDAAPRTPREVGRLAVALYYDDPAAAARWLRTVFELDTWDRVPEEGHPTWIELHAGASSIILLERTEKGTPAADHTVWVYVDDLDAHFAHAQGNGAKILQDIHQHGFRSYDAEDLEGHRWTFLQARPTMQ